MNTIREIQALNKREIENGVTPEGSWHADYRDTAYVYIGGLPFELSEGDIVTIFSQFGEPLHVNLVRDKETGKSRGFAFLKYEDQRSTDLAVDNLGGATILGRILKVDHTRYKRKDDEETGDNTAEFGHPGEKTDEPGRKRRRTSESGSEPEPKEEARPMLKEERELAQLMHDHDDDDPMKEYLIKEKKGEVNEALARWERGRRKDKEKARKGEDHERRHRHHHHHRERRREGSEHESDQRGERRRREVQERGERDGRRRDYESDRGRQTRDSDGRDSKARDDWDDEDDGRYREQVRRRRNRSRDGR